MDTSLQQRLDIRISDLSHSPPSARATKLCQLIGWIEAQPQLARLLASLPKPQSSAEEWLDGLDGRTAIDLPRDEAESTALCWAVLKHVASEADVQNAMWQVGFELVPGRSDTETALGAFLQTFLNPVVGWFEDRMLVGDQLLHSLIRYTREVAWFRREELRAKYAAGGNEASLDADLRHHLLREGIDFPFSQVSGPSGKPDVLVPDNEAQPIPLEVKVWEPPARGLKGLKQGFKQAVEYAHDYGRADGHLVIFDASDGGVAVQGDTPGEYPPSVASGAIRVFTVVVPIGVNTAASKKRSERTTVTADELRNSRPRKTGERRP